MSAHLVESAGQICPSAAFPPLLRLRAMQSSETLEDGVTIVALEGEIDLSCSPELRELLHAHAKARRPALVLDFSKVRYIDSSGLATLVEYVRLAQDYLGRFGLAAVDERVRTILDLVRLSEVFPIFPTVAEAKSALTAAAPGA
jgi:anti-sigma B factor antagonist